MPVARDLERLAFPSNCTPDICNIKSGPPPPGWGPPHENKILGKVLVFSHFADQLESVETDLPDALFATQQAAAVRISMAASGRSW